MIHIKEKYLIPQVWIKGVKGSVVNWDTLLLERRVTWRYKNLTPILKCLIFFSIFYLFCNLDGMGSKQQQVTTYAHKDENNVFVIKKWNEDAPNITDPQLEIEFVKNGDLVRLEHFVTR